MTKRKTSIHINGRHYDAVTGVLLSSDETTVATKPAAKSIDGVVGGTSATKHVAKPKAASVSPTVKATKPVVKRAPAVHAKTHQVKPSATLMRHAVAKPTTSSIKRKGKVQTPTTHAASELVVVGNFTVAPKLSLHSINPKRAKHASQVAMSPKVARFAHKVALTTELEAEQLANTANTALVIPDTFNPNVVYEPTPLNSKQRHTSDIFEKALLRATSHEEPAPNVKTKKGRRVARSLRRRMVSFTAGAVVMMALLGAFGYHHSDSYQFQAAASKAGFAATMPGYQPKGFAIDNVSAISGYVNVRYKSPTTNFAVVEKPSSLDSEALLNQIVNSPAGSGYVTIEKAGRTVYVYGRNQAAWVNHGILYQVLGNGALGTNEFGEIAASM